MENRAEIRGLESVTYGTKPVLIWLMVLGVPVIVIGISAMQFPDPVGLIAEFCTVMLVIIWLPASIWVLLTYRQSQFQTNSEGLYVRGVFRSRFIRWRNVKSIQTLPNWKYEFTTDQGRILFTPPGLSVQASILQHLRRYGLESDFKIPTNLQIIWNPEPTDFSIGTTWNNPEQVEMWPWSMFRWSLVLLGIVLMFLYYKYRHLHDLFNVLLFFYALLSYYANSLMFKYSPLVVRSITVTNDGLSIEFPKSRKDISWGEIRYVQTSKRYVYLLLRSGGAYIPLINGDKALHQVLMAISHGLGNRAQPLLFLVPDLSRTL